MTIDQILYWLNLYSGSDFPFGDEVRIQAKAQLQELIDAEVLRGKIEQTEKLRDYIDNNPTLISRVFENVLADLKATLKKEKI